MAIQVFACEVEGALGLDVSVSHSKATVADLLAAMQWATDDPQILKPFHRQRYAPCVGCTNNCCKHNYITPDLYSAEALASALGLCLSEFAKEYLCLGPDLPYPVFKRRPCPWLENNRCTVYEQRSLICRLYLCTPMSDRLEQLRAAVSFAGEAALRKRLRELGLGPSIWSVKLERKELLQRRKRGDISHRDWLDRVEQLEILWEINPFELGQTYHDIRLVDCCTGSLWQRLTGAQ